MFIKEKVHDQSELDKYTPKARNSLSGHPVKVLAAYGRHEVLEGKQLEGGVIVEFPTFAEAKAWYDSPAYSDARQHRFKGADYSAVIIDGL